MKRLYTLLIIALILLFSAPLSVRAQTTVQCGSIIESEFTANRERHEYHIDLAPGDILRVSTERVGDYLLLGINIDAPTTGRIINGGDNWGWSNEHPSSETSALSERGTYIVTVGSHDRQGVGIYTLYVSCTLRDGTVINPGDALTVQQLPTLTPVPTAAPGYSGFPGLAPVDFSNVAQLPLIAGAPMSGAVTPTGGEILGFTIDASAGDVIDLSFMRLSGNLNLGLVVLSEDNEVAFQASLVTSESLSTRFTLPSGGQYTIGVFRIDLVPPDEPQSTAFQVQANLNP